MTSDDDFSPTEVTGLRVCERTHGGPRNAASVYGHPGVRSCIRLHGTHTWVYDPRWEQPGALDSHEKALGWQCEAEES